jgi:AcrR family transcriptional regulator
LNTKITDITAEAGRAAGSFYNHFSSKEELLKALLADMLEASDAAVLATDSSHSSDFSDPAAVRWHVAAYWRFAREHLVELTAIRQAALVNEEFAASLDEMMAADAAHLLGHFEYVRAAGRTLPASPRLVMMIISSLLDGFVQRWETAGGHDETDDEVIDALATFIHRGLNGTNA